MLEDLIREQGCGGFITTFGELLSPVELVGGAHKVGHLMLLQQLDVVVHSPVLENTIFVNPYQVTKMVKLWNRNAKRIL